MAASRCIQVPEQMRTTEGNQNDTQVNGHISRHRRVVCTGIRRQSARLDRMTQVDPVDKLHHEEVKAIHLAEFIDRDDIWMVQLGRELRQAQSVQADRLPGAESNAPTLAYLPVRRVVTSKMTAAARTAPRTMYCREMSVPIRFMPLVREM